MDFLPSKVKDSPIVSESSSISALFGVSTTF
jgi:outer membrane scaffolding protein for murein synthesis (MipA/OmpV family)